MVLCGLKNDQVVSFDTNLPPSVTSVSLADVPPRVHTGLSCLRYPPFSNLLWWNPVPMTIVYIYLHISTYMYYVCSTYWIYVLIAFARCSKVNPKIFYSSSADDGLIQQWDLRMKNKPSQTYTTGKCTYLWLVFLLYTRVEKSMFKLWFLDLKIKSMKFPLKTPILPFFSFKNYCFG